VPRVPVFDSDRVRIKVNIDFINVGIDILDAEV
jgi:hypothetical protein